MSNQPDVVDMQSIRQHAQEDMRRKTDGIRPDEPKFVTPLTVEDKARIQTRHQLAVQRIIEQCLADGRPVPPSLLK